MDTSSRRVAIVGAAESDLGVVKDKTVYQLHAQAAQRALADAGLSHGDVDGLMTAGPFAYLQTMEVAEYLGITPRWTDSTNTGGSAFEIQVEHAAAAIASGAAEVILITYGSTQRSEGSRPGTSMKRNPYEGPYGFQLPMAGYALAAQRHMWQYGTTLEQLAEIAVAARAWAQLNPNAYRRDPLSIEDVMASPVVMSPLRKLDSCLVTDGGGAVVVASERVARQCRHEPVFVLGAAHAHTHMSISQMPDLTATAAQLTGPEALKRAGVTHADIDVLQTYDSFTITVLLALEDLGFCAKGEGGAFVEGGRIGPGGGFPVNTSGGGLSYCHPGMFGMFLLIEATRQLRGDCGERQVPDARISLCHGVGGVLAAHGTVVLGVD